MESQKDESHWRSKAAEALNDFYESENERLKKEIRDRLVELRSPVFLRSCTGPSKEYLRGILACIEYMEQKCE